MKSKAAVHTCDLFPFAFSSSPGPSLRCPLWRSANRHHIYAPPFRCAGRQRARVTAQSIQQLGLPGESNEVGISLSPALSRSLSCSPSRSLAPFLSPPRRSREGRGGGTHELITGGSPSVCVGMCECVHIIIVARKSFLWLSE